MDIWGPFRHRSSVQAPNKFVSATAVADYGDSQALALAPNRASFSGFNLGGFSIYNRSGGAALIGLAVRFPVDRWLAGQVTAAGAFTDDTADAQNATTNDFSLHNGADSGSGFLIAAEAPFNVIGIVQSTAGDQAGPTLIIEYWNGTSWVNIVTANYAADTLNPGATNERLIAFPLPTPWVVGGSGTGVPADYYNLRLRHTNSGPGSVNPLAAQMFIGASVVLSPAVANGGIYTIEPANELRAHRWGDALFGVFSVTHIDNAVDLSWGYI